MGASRALPNRYLRGLRALVFIAALLPLASLVHGYLTGSLSVNPLDDITDATGTWTLRFVVMTLAITPLRALTSWSQVATFRKMTGNFAFFYGSLHLLTYLYFDKFFLWEDIVLDIPQRRFILVGFTAWTLMLPLAVTSVRQIMRWMGGRRWKMLHRTVYLIAILGVVHYYWLVKFDTFRPVIYGVIVGALLLYRLVDAFVRRRTRIGGDGVR